MADRYLIETSAVDGYLMEDGLGVLLLEVSAGAGRIHRAAGLDGLAGGGQQRFYPLLSILLCLLALS